MQRRQKKTCSMGRWFFCISCWEIKLLGLHVELGKILPGSTMRGGDGERGKCVWARSLQICVTTETSARPADGHRVAGGARGQPAHKKGVSTGRGAHGSTGGRRWY